MSTVITVVGIGADGWGGLSATGRDALRAAAVVIGGERQLGYLPTELDVQRVGLPTPLVEGLPGLLAQHEGSAVVVLASGDPMHHGIGSTLVRLLGPGAVKVISHPSSISLACARLRWSVEEIAVLSVVGRPLERLHALLHPGARILVLSSGSATPQAVLALLTRAGCGASRVAVLEQLGSRQERLHAGVASELTAPEGGFDPLNVIAISVALSADAPTLGVTPGLPDDAYQHDGQLTKREIRALTLARLAPLPGQLLWDVGGGAGSVGIEWMRAAAGALAICIERRVERAVRIESNAKALGVPDLQVVQGAAPEALLGLSEPDAIFVGGGGSDPAVLEACWAALPPGGRMVANAVTLQTEAALVARCTQWGGSLTRLEISHAVPLGRFSGWHAEHPVTQWVATK